MIYSLKHVFDHYALPAIQYPYDILESYLMDSHPYHPCYKSRMGFPSLRKTMYAMVWSSPNQSPWSSWLCIRTLLQKKLIQKI